MEPLLNKSKIQLKLASDGFPKLMTDGFPKSQLEKFREYLLTLGHQL